MISPNRKALLGLSLGLLLPLAAIAHPAEQHASMPFDQHFMGKMIPHHEMGIGMAKECEQKATHGELKELCQQIASKQQEENGKMQSWLDAWYKGEGAMSPQGMGKKTMPSMGKMSSMSGAEYEKMFLREMSKHHQQALSDTKPCMDRATHSELKDLCKMITEGQQKEIQQMRTWSCDWYKQDCGGKAKK